MNGRFGRSAANYRHGFSKSKDRRKRIFYNRWCDMRKRCRLVTTTRYSRYGGRGIKVCKRWLSFGNFKKDMWSAFLLAFRKDPKTSLDRKNGDKNYSKNNCRWTDAVTQGNNTSRNFRITFKGRTRTLAEWSRSTGVKARRLRDRIVKLKWPLEQAFTLPKQKI